VAVCGWLWQLRGQVGGDQFLGGGFVVDGPSTDAAPQAMPKSNTGQLILALDGR